MMRLRAGGGVVLEFVARVAAVDIEWRTMQAEQFRLNHQVELAHWWFVGRRRILRAVVDRLLPNDARHTLIDVGCGTGGNIGSFVGAYHCVGIDPSSEAIAFARSRHPQVEFVCGEAPRDLGPRSAEADLFLLTDVLEHVPDDFAILSDLWGAARPGAYFIITVPAEMDLWSMHDISHAHYRRYDANRLARVWRDLPASTLMLSAFNTRLYPIVRAARAFNRWRGRASGAADTDLSLPPAWMNRALEATFAGERHRLCDLMAGRIATGYRRGVSLMAVLRREPGLVEHLTWPADIEPDIHGPHLDRTTA